MLRYHIWTIGCQMNKAYSEQLATDLLQLGFSHAENAEEADIIVVNSCVVRQSAENRVTARLNSLKQLKKRKPGLLVALTGCIVEPDASALRYRFPQVDLLLKPGESVPLLDLVKEKASGVINKQSIRSNGPCAFVTIIEGCDNFCSYCIVPYRRGRERSHPMHDIYSRVENLVRLGIKEVTLLGQNVDSYGHDLPGEPGLADLLNELNCINELSRIRFLTSHPKDMSEKLIQAVASLDKVCECISLPVQSGDNVILQEMGRVYTVQHYRELVERIKAVIPGVAISTDIIVGFPGETTDQFQGTYDLLSNVKFDVVHVAAYSPRPGTKASRELADDVPQLEKKRRLQEVEKLQEEIVTEINSSLQGQVVEILVEGKKKGKWWGRTRTGKLVFFSDETNRLGQLIDIEIEITSPWSLQGILRERESESC